MLHANKSQVWGLPVNSRGMGVGHEQASSAAAQAPGTQNGKVVSRAGMLCLCLSAACSKGTQANTSPDGEGTEVAMRSPRMPGPGEKTRV